MTTIETFRLGAQMFLAWLTIEAEKWDLSLPSRDYTATYHTRRNRIADSAILASIAITYGRNQARWADNLGWTGYKVPNHFWDQWLDRCDHEGYTHGGYTSPMPGVDVHFSPINPVRWETTVFPWAEEEGVILGHYNATGDATYIASVEAGLAYEKEYDRLMPYDVD